MSKMMRLGYAVIVLIALVSSPFLFDVPTIQAQTVVDVDETTPCFLDYDAGVDMWKDCGMDQDFLKAVLMPMEWVMGGYFSLVIVSIIVVMIYIKYQTVIYPLAIGIIMLPLSYFVFPDELISYVFLFAGIAIYSVIHTIVIKRTNA